MTPAGFRQLLADEGFRPTAYRDTGGVWTVGYGETGPNVTRTSTRTIADAMAFAEARARGLANDLTRRFAWFSHLSPVRQDVLVNIAYNVGFAELCTWTITLGHFAGSAWDAAAHDLLTEGAWNRQVGDRAVRLAAAVRDNKWPDPG